MYNFLCVLMVLRQYYGPIEQLLTLAAQQERDYALHRWSLKCAIFLILDISPFWIRLNSNSECVYKSCLELVFCEMKGGRAAT